MVALTNEREVLPFDTDGVWETLSFCTERELIPFLFRQALLDSR